jgi:hypothetical protein
MQPDGVDLIDEEEEIAIALRLCRSPLQAYVVREASGDAASLGEIAPATSREVFRAPRDLPQRLPSQLHEAGSQYAGISGMTTEGTRGFHGPKNLVVAR